MERVSAGIPGSVQTFSGRDLGFQVSDLLARHMISNGGCASRAMLTSIAANRLRVTDTSASWDVRDGKIENQAKASRKRCGFPRTIEYDNSPPKKSPAWSRRNVAQILCRIVLAASHTGAIVCARSDSEVLPEIFASGAITAVSSGWERQRANRAPRVPSTGTLPSLARGRRY